MRTSYIKQIIFIASFAILFSLSGCKSKKALTGGGQLAEKTHSQVIADVIGTQLKYTSISTKGNIEFKIGSSGQKAPAVYKLIKDSVLQVSIRIPIPLLGSEVFRVNITPDSIVIIDRMKKRYVSEDISVLGKNAGFNFYNLQDLFTNQLFYPGDKSVDQSDYEKYTISSANNLYLLQAKNKTNTTYNFAVDATNRISSTLIYNKKKDITIQWTYSDFMVDNQYTYPTTMSAKVDVAKKRLDVDITFSKLDIDNAKGLDVDMSIPSKYTKVDLSEILSAYLKAKK